MKNTHRAKNILTGLAVLALGIVLSTWSLTGCSNPADDMTPTDGQTVINIAAIRGVTAPVTGAKPAAAIIPTEQYTGTVTWNSNPHTGSVATFAADTQYIATITLTAKNGFTLQGVAADFFRVAGTTLVSNSANSGVITAVFPRTGGSAKNPVIIDATAIEGVTIPATGGTPVTTIENEQYSGTVTWSPDHSTFNASTEYTATITLTPKAGYTLQGVTFNYFTIDGAASVSNAANSGVITALFPSTDAVTINIAAIQGVIVPVNGEIPVTEITENEQYSGTVTWSPEVIGTFAAVTQYTATISLTPKAGYTLQGVTFNYFTVDGASAGNNANSGVITAVFPATAPTIIPSVSISIIAPVNGATPGTSATTNVNAEDGDVFTIGTVSWLPPGTSSFLGNTVYTALVTLTAAHGFTFNGLDSATINGQNAAVSNNTGSAVTLSYTFPATNTKIVTGIAIKTQPAKLTYTHDNTLDLAGLVVTLTHDDTTTEDIAAASFADKNVTANPAAGNNLIYSIHNGKPVKITYGDLTCNTNNLTVNRLAPVADDFTIVGTGTFTYDGNIKTVTITPKPGKSNGARTVKYNGSTSAPSDAGTYTITFDVAEAGDYANVSGIYAGTLTIEKATPTAADFTISGTGTFTYDGSSRTVTVEPKAGKSNGTRTVYYEGTGSTTYTKSTTAPSAVGEYTVTFNVAEGTNFNAASGLSAGTLTITIAAFTTEPTLTLTAGNGSLDFTWIASNPAADSYDIYWKVGSGLSAADVKTGTKITGATSGGSINGLTNDTAYSVLVTANKTGYNAIDSTIKVAVIPTRWARTVSSGSGDSFFQSVAVDSSGNVYAAGYQYGTDTYTYGTGISAQGSSSRNNALLVKYNSSGTALWARTVSSGDGNSSFFSVAVDSSGNVYAAGSQSSYTSVYTYDTGVSAQGSSSQDNVVLVKYNSSGTALWARTVSSGNGATSFQSVAVDSSGNVYAAGYQSGDTTITTYTYGTGVSAKGSSLTRNAVLVKYNSSGTAQWARTTSAGNNMTCFLSVAVDSSDNVYAAGTQNDTVTYTYGSGVFAQGSSSSSNVVLVKYNSSGTALWAQTSSTGFHGSAFTSVAVDSSGNVYAAGLQAGSTSVYTYGTGVSAQGPNASQNNVVLVKYNSSGTALWARTLVSTDKDNARSGFQSVAVDSSGNVYAAGEQGGYGTTYSYDTGVSAQGPFPTNEVLVKYNSSGTALWARTVSSGSGNSYFSSVAVDSSGNVYAAGYQQGTGSFTYGMGVSAQGNSSGENVVLVKYKE
jgi:hypothetical protein